MSVKIFICFLGSNSTGPHISLTASLELQNLDAKFPTFTFPLTYLEITNSDSNLFSLL